MRCEDAVRLLAAEMNRTAVLGSSARPAAGGRASRRSRPSPALVPTNAAVGTSPASVTHGCACDRRAINGVVGPVVSMTRAVCTCISDALTGRRLTRENRRTDLLAVLQGALVAVGVQGG